MTGTLRFGRPVGGKERTIVKAATFIPSIVAILSFQVFSLFSSASPKTATTGNANVRSAKKSDGGSGCWNVIPSPNVGTSTNNLYAVSGSGNDVWAVGAYNTGPGAGNIWKTLTLHWDGSTWAVVPSPNVGSMDNFLFGVSGSGNDAWAVGAYSTLDQGFLVGRSLTLHWDGSAWTVVPSPNPGFWGNDLQAVIGSGNDVWAVGDYSTGFGRTLTLHWDQSTWSHVPSPNIQEQNNDQLNAVAGSGNDVWAVGYEGFLGFTLTLHWNGSAWSLVPSPNPGLSVNQLQGVSGSGDDVWAVGVYDIFGDIYRTLTLHWNGSAWSQEPSPNLGTGQNQLNAVSGSGNDVWAVGTDSAHTVTLHWNGNAWSLVLSPNVGTGQNQLRGVIGGGNDVWTVGEYNSPGGNNQTLTLHWTSPCVSTPTPTPTPTPTRTPTPTPTLTYSDTDAYTYLYAQGDADAKD